MTEAQAKELPTQRLVLSRDGRSLYLASAHGIQVIDTATLTARTRWLGSTSFSSLVISPDGTSLFATAVVAGTTQLDQVDSPTGGLVSETEVRLTVLGLERVANAKPYMNQSSSVEARNAPTQLPAARPRPPAPRPIRFTSEHRHFGWRPPRPQA